MVMACSGVSCQTRMRSLLSHPHSRESITQDSSSFTHPRETTRKCVFLSTPALILFFLKVSEIINFKQSDLRSGQSFILDTFDEVYVYSGTNATVEQKFKATQAALGLVKHSDRSKQASVINVDEGEEPLRFRLQFDWKAVPTPAAQSQVFLLLMCSLD